MEHISTILVRVFNATIQRMTAPAAPPPPPPPAGIQPEPGVRS